MFFFFSSRRRHTRLVSDWSSDVCSSDLFGVSVDDLNHIAAWLTAQNLTVIGTGRARNSIAFSGTAQAVEDRKSVVEGKSGEVGGGRRAIEKERGEWMAEWQQRDDERARV